MKTFIGFLLSVFGGCLALMSIMAICGVDTIIIRGQRWDININTMLSAIF